MQQWEALRICGKRFCDFKIDPCGRNAKLLSLSMDKLSQFQRIEFCRREVDRHLDRLFHYGL
ncbi:Uncharacterised protein [Vibrio cholerae]|nr:Uncharacterised protein [Vibrio cholerae]